MVSEQFLRADQIALCCYFKVVELDLVDEIFGLKKGESVGNTDWIIFESLAVVVRNLMRVTRLCSLGLRIGESLNRQFNIQYPFNLLLSASPLGFPVLAPD